MLAELASVGAIAGAAMGGYAYAANWPTSQLFGSTIVAGSDAQEIALTFDDGPNDSYTLRLLEILARHNVRATFFLIGRFVRQRPQIARAIREAGHVVGNHTMTHPVLLWQGIGHVRDELAACCAAIEDAIGERTEYFRPPHGARRPDILRAARALGLTPVMWNITSGDWAATSATQLEARIREGIRRNRRRGSNLLLHDGGHLQLGADRSLTLAVVASLLESWAGSGRRLVTVDAWNSSAATHRNSA